jgi:choline dehydrogenase-like flavoprotein
MFRRFFTNYSKYSSTPKQINTTKQIMIKGGCILGATLLGGIGVAKVINSNRLPGFDEFNPKYKYIIVGGGTGGCITAYFLAKWMEDYNVVGDVLLIDSGDNYTANPTMWNWFEIWGKYNMPHETFAETIDGSTFYPAVASSHIGIGGCSTHDTRITFIPSDSQASRMAQTMGWHRQEFDMYIQTALNMIPLQSASDGDKFYDKLIDTLDQNGIVKRIDVDNEYKAKILADTIGYVSIAMFPDESRWAGVFLLHPSICPKKLKIVTNSPVDRVLIETNNDIHSAIGVITNNGDTFKVIKTGEVVVTAGSLGTPAILQRSGMGSKHILDPLNIQIIKENDEIGHGVDHSEVAVMYSWLNNVWGDNIPRGGPMAWPLALFFKNSPPSSSSSDTDADVMAHFGINAPPYYGGTEVTGTPNCVRPDHSKGFYAYINSTKASDPIQVYHKYAESDFKQLALGIRKMVEVFEILKTQGIVGNRIEPPESLDIDNDVELYSYIKTHLGTAYHWMSTCAAGKVVDPRTFSVYGVANLRIGSGAVLPEIPGANPHLTISAFSIALAYKILCSNLPTSSYNVFIDEFMTDVPPVVNHKNTTNNGSNGNGSSNGSNGNGNNTCTGDKFDNNMQHYLPLELRTAIRTLDCNSGKYTIRRYNEVYPDLQKIINEHKLHKLHKLVSNPPSSVQKQS